VAAVAIAAVLSACGGDDAATGSPSASVSAAATATRAPTPTLSPSPTANPGPLAEATPDPAAWATYTSSAFRFSIGHPAEWTVAAAEDVTLTPPSSPETTVLVEFGPMPAGGAYDRSLQATAVEAARGHYGGSAQVLGVYNLGGRPAILLEWTQASDNGQYGLQAWIPNGDESWYITMLTPVPTKDEYSNTFRQLLDSFQSES
jgi:hypothetical protein